MHFLISRKFKKLLQLGNTVFCRSGISIDFFFKKKNGQQNNEQQKYDVMLKKANFYVNVCKKILA